MIGVFGTAEQLMKEYAENEANKKTLPWARPPRSGSTQDSRILRIGTHHCL